MGKLKIPDLSQILTPEYFEKLELDCYKDDRSYPENFSNWYPSIINFGVFKHSEILINKIFTLEETKTLRNWDNIKDVDYKEFNRIMQPVLDKLKDSTLYSIKNGCFSNKFDFSTCIVTKDNFIQNYILLSQQSSLFETGGYTELVVRSLIPYDNKKTPTIYNGMPLREELRVFYNMDTKQIEYMVDYWDYDYCRPNIYNFTDTIIFDWFHNIIPGREVNHSDRLNKMKSLVEKSINTLEFNNNLNGIWSIDFLYSELEDDVYLIDMARGFRSAYWDINKINKGDCSNE